MTAFHKTLSFMGRQQLLFKQLITISARYLRIWNDNHWPGWFWFGNLGHHHDNRFRCNFNLSWTNIIVNTIIPRQVINMIVIMKESISEDAITIKVIIVSISDHS
jgi:hypothetical protein